QCRKDSDPAVIRALGASRSNPAQPEASERKPRRPDRTVTIFEQVDDRSVGFRVPCHGSAVPADQAAGRADPERTVARAEQTSDGAGRKALTSGRLPFDRTDAIEAQQPEFGPQPEISIARLRDGRDHPLSKAFAVSPHGMYVLADVERRVQRERGPTPRE